MKYQPILKVVSIFSISILNASANEFNIPDSHEKHLPELLKLAEELECEWNEVVFDQADPSTWVIAGKFKWSKIRGKVIGTILCPGVGTIIGHQVDLHDDREQTRKNNEIFQAFNRGTEQTREENSRLRLEMEQRELEHQRAMAKAAEERRIAEINQNNLNELIANMKIEMARLSNQVPDTVIDVVKSINILYGDRLITAQSSDEVEKIFKEYCRVLETIIQSK